MPLTSSYTPNYFSIDDILATQEKLPCTFEFTLHRLGFLDPSSDSKDLPAGTSLQLPLWLAKSLASRQHKIVQVDIPRPYKESYREIFKADASVVNLHRLGPYFYEVGMQVLAFQPKGWEEIGITLVQTFKDRFRRLMDVSQNSLDSDSASLTSTLDELEKSLFAAGQLGLGNHCDWLHQSTGRIHKAQLVAQHHKRKLAQMEAS